MGRYSGPEYAREQRAAIFLAGLFGVGILLAVVAAICAVIWPVR